MRRTTPAPYWGLQAEPLNLAIATLAGIGFLLFGYDQGVMGGLLTLPTFVATFPELDTTSAFLTSEQKKRNSTVQGVSVAIYEIGCMFGALSCLYIGDWLGRRRVIFWGALIMVVGACLQSTAFSLAHFIVGRIVTGCGNGLITATVPTWQSECSKPHKRGKLVMIEGALITGGICLSYWIDFGFYFAQDTTMAWRLPIALQIIFGLIIMLTVLKLPESPRWLIKKGRIQEAEKVFAALNGTSSDSAIVQREVKEIEHSLALSGQSGLKDLFKMGPSRNLHRAILGFVIQCFQQISGINLISFYAATIYENYLGLSPTLSRILAACNGTEYFLASWVPVYTVETFGRRKLMLFGAVGMFFSMTILTVTSWAADPIVGRDSKPAAIVAAVFLFIFNTFFAIGWLGMTWLYPAEIACLSTRAASNGISTASNWIFNFLIVLITPISFENIGYKTYIIFAVTNFLMIPSVYYFFPETAYRSLEEIDEIFEKSNWFTVVMNSFPSVTPLRFKPEESKELVSDEKEEEKIF
ncbi:general substrate transporter [Melampsora americana]|nr:general substrate transporter [Melampsora americana]